MSGTAQHGDRAHATWSASATARNWHCAGALTLAQYAPPGKESTHAARGTACHQIAEKCLRTGVDAMSFLDTVEQAKSISVTIDEELANTAQEYVDYVRDGVTAGASLQIEQHFDLVKLNPPFDAGGTGDAVLHFSLDKVLEVVDLKAGMGVVDAKGNPQLRTYALGAMLANPGLDVTQIKVTIIQPRAPHRDGPSETFHVADLVEWTADLLAAMKRSKQAMDEHAAAGGNTVLLDEWNTKWLKPGKCTFCPVEGSCPALKRDALSVAAVWFDDMDQPRIGNAALDTDPSSLARDLDMIPMLEDWVKARRAFAHAQAEQGVEIPGYQLVDKIGNRKWADEDAVCGALSPEFGDTVFNDPKLKSPAQMEKLLGSKRKALIEPFVVREVTGTNLVSTSKTSRPAAKSVADKFFEA
jgi:hypothetical protein